MHPSTESIMQFFVYDHLSQRGREISKPCADLAHEMSRKLDGPELTAGLRKLLEAKDCFVRAAVAEKATGGVITKSQVYLAGE